MDGSLGTIAGELLYICVILTCIWLAIIFK